MRIPQQALDYTTPRAATTSKSKSPVPQTSKSCSTRPECFEAYSATEKVPVDSS